MGNGEQKSSDLAPKDSPEKEKKYQRQKSRSIWRRDVEKAFDAGMQTHF